MLVSEMLKTQTATDHRNLEAQMFVEKILNRTLSFSQYQSLMQINHAATLAIEPVIFNALPFYLQQDLSVDTRNKITALRKDLKALGLSQTVFHLSNQPKYDTVPAALGGMYVLEGATLGGNVIAKHLRQIESLKEQPFYFYTIYGNTIGTKWRQFIEVFNREVKAETADACITAARETFRFYSDVAQKVIHAAVE